MSNVVPLRPEPPLRVGAWVCLRHSPGFMGVVRALDDGEAWIKWMTVPPSRETGPVEMFRVLEMEKGRVG